MRMDEGQQGQKVMTVSLAVWLPVHHQRASAIQFISHAQSCGGWQSIGLCYKVGATARHGLRRCGHQFDDDAIRRRRACSVTVSCDMNFCLVNQFNRIKLKVLCGKRITGALVAYLLHSKQIEPRQNSEHQRRHAKGRLSSGALLIRGCPCTLR